MSDGALATGWEQDLPAGDSIVRAGVLSVADRVEHQARVLGRPTHRDDHMVAAWLADSGMFSNFAVLTAPPASWNALATEVEKAIPTVADAIVLSPFPTSDLREQGFVLIGHPPFMVRPVGGTGPTAPAGLDIVEVTDGDGIRAFGRALVEGYPLSDMDPDCGQTLFCADGPAGPSRLFLGLVDGEPAATAGAHTACGVNHVEFVATREAFRGRGIGAAVTFAAATADPALPSVLISSDIGRRVYEGLGYFAVMRWTLWWRPAQPR